MPPPDITVHQAARPLHATVSWSVAICRDHTAMSRYARTFAREFYSTVTASCGALICLTQAPADADAVAGTPDGLRPDAAGHATRLAGLENRALSPQPAAPAALIHDQQEKSVSASSCFLDKETSLAAHPRRDWPTACSRKPHAGCSGMVLPRQDTSKNAANTLCPALPACSAPIAG